MYVFCLRLLLVASHSLFPVPTVSSISFLFAGPFNVLSIARYPVLSHLPSTHATPPGCAFDVKKKKKVFERNVGPGLPRDGTARHRRIVRGERQRGTSDAPHQHPVLREALGGQRGERPGM